MVYLVLLWYFLVGAGTFPAPSCGERHHVRFRLWPNIEPLLRRFYWLALVIRTLDHCRAVAHFERGLVDVLCDPRPVRAKRIAQAVVFPTADQFPDAPGLVVAWLKRADRSLGVAIGRQKLGQVVGDRHVAFLVRLSGFLADYDDLVRPIKVFPTQRVFLALAIWRNFLRADTSKRARA